MIVDGVRHLWTVKHEHHVLPPSAPGAVGGGHCREVFTAYREGHKRSPLRVAFTGGPGRFGGDPDKGIVWTKAPGSDRIESANLRTPGVAARLVQLGQARGWAPVDAATAAPLAIDDGFALLEQLARSP